MPSVNQFKALGVRLALVLHCFLVVWRVAESRGDDHYWLLLTAIVPLVVEGIYNVFKQNGVEWKLFSLCFFFYLGASLPGIWLLEIQKTMNYQNKNTSYVKDIDINGVVIPIRLSPDTWVLVVEEMMLYFMIVGRWLLPRGEVGREQLTQLLFAFIGIASDIMELFSLFDEDTSIRHNTTLTYVILGVWSLSVLQFTLTFITVHRPRRARGLRTTPEEFHDQEQQHRRSVLRVELLATILSLFMQDGPFLAVRLYTTVKYNVITYSLVFFTSKNVLVIMLLVYKIFLLLNKLCCPKAHEEADDLKHLDADLFGYDEDGDYDDDDYEDVVVRVRKNMLQNGQVFDERMGDLRKRGTQEKKGTINPIIVDAESGDFDKKQLARMDGQREPEDLRQAGELRMEKDLDRGDLREPRGFDMGTGQMGELQKVIDGPGTPAKKMERTKKYDKLMVQNEISEKGEKEAETSLTLDPSSSKNDLDAIKLVPKTTDENAEMENQNQSNSPPFSDKELNDALGDLDKISDDSGHQDSENNDGVNGSLPRYGRAGGTQGAARKDDSKGIGRGSFVSYTSVHA